MSFLEYEASARMRARHEAAALAESEAIIRESLEQFQDHLDWLLCDLRSEKLHSDDVTNTFEEQVREALKALEI